MSFLSLMLMLLMTFIVYDRAAEGALQVVDTTDLTVEGQGILPLGQKTEVFGIELEESDDTGTSTLVRLEFLLEEYDSGDYEFWNPYNSNCISEVDLYRTPITVSDTQPAFDPSTATLVGHSHASGGSITFSTSNTMSDESCMLFVVIVPADKSVTGFNLGKCDDPLTIEYEKRRAVFTLHLGILYYIDSPAPLETKESPLDTTCQPLVFEGFVRNMYQYYYFAKSTDSQTDVTVTPPDTFLFPGYSDRPRWDLTTYNDEDTGLPPRPEMNQLLPLDTPVAVLGIACAGGTTSENRDEHIERLDIKFEDMSAAHDGFDPRTMLDPIIPHFYTESQTELDNFKYSGVLLYKDADADGEWELTDWPLPPDSYSPSSSWSENASTGTYTLTYNVPTGEVNSGINRVSSERYSFFVVIRADSGHNDANPKDGGDGVGVKYGAQFRVYIDPGDIYFQNANSDRGANATDFSTTPSDLSGGEYRSIPIYSGAAYRSYISSNTSLGWNKVDAVSAVIPVFGLNLVDTSDQTVLLSTGGGAKLGKLRVYLTSVSEFIPSTDLAALSPAATLDEDTKNKLRGISLWKDNKSAGRIGIFDEEYDTPVWIYTPSLTQTGSSEWYVDLRPIVGQEVYPNDTYSGGYRGDDYFVCIKSSSAIAYGDRFSMRINTGELDLGPITSTTGESSGLIVDSGTITANVPTILTDLTEQNQLIAASSDPTPVIGINLYDNNTGRTTKFNSLIVEFYNDGNPDDFNKGFNPFADLAPMGTGASSGLALYKDTNNNGVFDSGTDQVVPLSGAPSLVGMLGEVNYHFQMTLATPETIANSDGNGGPDYFVVIRTSDGIDTYDRFRVAIVGWGSEPQGNNALAYYDSDLATATYSYERVMTNAITTGSLFPEGSYSGGQPDYPATNPGGGGGCFIATAAYGTPLAEEVKTLQEFRDRYLLTNRLGKALVGVYYRFSPRLAEAIAHNEGAKKVTRAFLRPLVWTAKEFLNR